MGPKSSLPHSQDPATCPYPMPDLSIPCPHSISRRSIAILQSIYFWVFQMVFFPQFSPPKPCIHLSSNALPSVSFLFDHPKMFGEEYRTRSFSLCSLHHPPVTSSLLDTNILLSTLFSKNLSLIALLRGESATRTLSPKFRAPSLTPSQSTQMAGIKHSLSKVGKLFTLSWLRAPDRVSFAKA